MSKSRAVSRRRVPQCGVPQGSVLGPYFMYYTPRPLRTSLSLIGCVPLRRSGSGSVIRDHSDHGKSNEPMNPLWTRIHRFIWSTMIRVISDHWSWSGSSQRNAPIIYSTTSMLTTHNYSGSSTCARSARERNLIHQKLWESTHPRNFGNHVTIRPPARRADLLSVHTTGIPIYNNSIDRYGNPNATRGYLGGKSHSHPRLVKQRQKRKAEIASISVLSKVLSLG